MCQTGRLRHLRGRGIVRGNQPEKDSHPVGTSIHHVLQIIWQDQREETDASRGWELSLQGQLIQLNQQKCHSLLLLSHIQRPQVGTSTMAHISVLIPRLHSPLSEDDFYHRIQDQNSMVNNYITFFLQGQS